jgi:hypothetical protein
MSDTDFTLKLATVIKEGISNDIHPYLIIGFIEAAKQSMINELLGVQDECE